MTLERALGVTIPFGKHKGETLGSVLDQDPVYLDLLFDMKIHSPILRQALVVLSKNEGVQSKIDQAVF